MSVARRMEEKEPLKRGLTPSHELYLQENSNVLAQSTWRLSYVLLHKSTRFALSDSDVVG